MTRIEITKEQKDMLESMPQGIAISVMISLAANLIRSCKGELGEVQLSEDPIELIAEISLATMFANMRADMEQPAVEPSERH